MKKIIVVLIGIAAVAGGVLYVQYQKHAQQTQEAITESVSPEPTASAEPRYPLPSLESASTESGQPAAKPLPALGESDGPFLEELAALAPAQPIKPLAITPDFIRRATAIIDNLTQDKLPLRLMPVKGPSGELVTTQQSEEVYLLDSANYARYEKYVNLLGALDSKQLASLYVRYYPLFQQAYRELGYPSGHLNDQLIGVMDHLLATPESQEPVKLIRPSVYYKYADPKLESLSAGQKLLIRMGNGNATRVKDKLRQLRIELTR